MWSGIPRVATPPAGDQILAPKSPPYRTHGRFAPRKNCPGRPGHAAGTSARSATVDHAAGLTVMFRIMSVIFSLSTTSMPDVTRPITTYFPVIAGAFARRMNN